LFQILMFGLVWLIMIKLKKLLSFNKENFILAIFFVMSFSQALCVNDLISFSVCSTYDTVDFVFGNLAVHCDDSYQLFRMLYVLPMLMFWMIVFPGGTWMYLYLNQTKMNKPSWRGRLGFYYNSYKDQYYYWEFLKMILKSGIVVLSLWTLLDVKTRVLTSIFVLVIMGFETYRHQPSRNEKINDLDVKSWAVLSLTFFFAYFGYNPSYLVIEYVSDYGFMLLVNLYFLMIMFGSLFNYLKKMGRKFSEKFKPQKEFSNATAINIRAISARPAISNEQIQMMKKNGKIGEKEMLFEALLKRSGQPTGSNLEGK